jgi:very-short-patch-repair endonuclease
MVLDDFRFYVDVIFRKLKLVIEIDGRLYHTGPEVFETDRWRQNLLVLNGWFALRFTWAMIEEHLRRSSLWCARQSSCCQLRGSESNSERSRTTGWSGPDRDGWS